MNRKFLALTSLAFSIIVWQSATLLNIVSPLFLPSPIEVGKTLLNLIFAEDNNILFDVLATSYRTAIAFGLAATIGIPFGLLIGYYKTIRLSSEFFVDFFRSIPATALFPLFMLIFGIHDSSKIAAAAFAGSLIITVNTMYGVKQVKKARILVARTMNVSNRKMFKDVIFPDALPSIFAGLRTTLSLTLVIIIVTEMFIGTKVGLGARIIDASLIYSIPEMYTAIILSGLLGFSANKLALLAEKKIVHWVDQ